MLIKEVSTSAPTNELDRLELQGAALIRRKIRQLQLLQLRVRQLGKIPRSKRTILMAEELSLAVFNAHQVEFAIGVLASRLRWLQFQRKGQQVVSALRLAAPVAPNRVMPATHIAGAQN